MIKDHFRSLGSKVALLAALAWPTIGAAQTFFTSTTTGDVDAGFRKMGTFQEKYEMVAYLGNITNFLAVPAGVTINVTNFNYQQLTNMCPDNLANLQWSVFSTFSGNALTNSLGVFPLETCWYTVPRASVNSPTTPVARFGRTTEGSLEEPIYAVSVGANLISSGLGSTNVYNNTLVVLEPDNNANFTTYLLTANIGDPGANGGPAWGDFGGITFTFTVENTTPSPFTSATVSDFYMNVPASSGRIINLDPLTGLQNGNADYLGYFTLNPNGTMTFTRASATPAAPVASFAGSPTSGFAPVKTVFTDASTGSITNWVWNFGDGHTFTNTVSSSATNTYAAGSYTVSLTVSGPGGANTSTLASYVAASATPKLGIPTLVGTNLVFRGSNGPAGVQYRILTATNLALPLASWTPVLTNLVSSSGGYAFTNSTTRAAAFFVLVSP
jgi:PKD repeat protein